MWIAGGGASKRTSLQSTHIKPARDQKHSKCVLGCGSKHEYLVPVGPDGEYLHPDDGGVMPARMPTTVPKFAQEARKAYSVMMKEVDGQMRGFKAKPFDYTGTLLVGPKKYATR